MFRQLRKHLGVIEVRERLQSKAIILGTGNIDSYLTKTYTDYQVWRDETEIYIAKNG